MEAFVVAADPVHENSINYFSAALGLYRLGYHVERYDLKNLPALDVDGDTPVFGGTESINILLPTYQNLPYYPTELETHMHRKVSRVKIEDAKEGDFIKPVEEQHKLFSPAVVEASLSYDLLRNKIPAETEVIVSEQVNFESEFRVYVLGGKILDICFYKGDPTIFPDSTIVGEMVSDCAYLATAFGLDVGVTDSCKTAVVEMNDFCCLGNYGLKSTEYAKCIATRWEELWGLYGKSG